MTASTVTTAATAALSAEQSTHAQPVLPGDLREDGVLDACPPLSSSMPQHGRLDSSGRAVVVTARLGATMILQRIGLNAYRGVAAQLIGDGTDAPSVRITLRHAERAYDITLEKALPLEEAVAVWRGWSDSLCVPLLLTEENGEDSIVRNMLGATLVKAVQPRKSRGLGSRRPRFSKRRGYR